MRGVLLCALAAVIVLSACNSPEQDAFAQCVTESGATFYGVFWCPHCAEQKKLFGSSIQHIRYVECDLRGQNPQPVLCQQKKIASYPTWEFGDGTFLSGVLKLSTIAQKTKCTLPP